MTELAVCGGAMVAPKGKFSTFITDKMDKVKLHMQLRDANKSLDIFYNQFQGLKSNGVPQGEVRYCVLAKRVHETIMFMSNARGIEPSEIMIERPELGEMAVYAKRPDETSKAKKQLAGILGLVFGSPIVLGVMVNLFHHVARFHF